MPLSVLQVGDSHSVLAYGPELHRLLTEAGATVTAYAASGSSPLSWISGYTAKTTAVPPFSTIAPDGTADVTPAGSSHSAPTLQSLLTKHRPELVIISLGANMRWMQPPQATHDAVALAKIAVAGGAKLLWVGPPPQKSDLADRGKYEAFNGTLAGAVAPYGRFVSSSALVDRYSGTDGLHFNTPEGEAIAKAWARGVFDVFMGAGASSSASSATEALSGTCRRRGMGGTTLLVGGVVIGGLVVAALRRRSAPVGVRSVDPQRAAGTLRGK